MAKKDDKAAMKRKICLLGSPGVGKTSLINRFVSNIFGDDYLTTIGTKVTKKTMVLPHPVPPKKGLFGPKGPTKVKLDMAIWDVAGQKSGIMDIKSAYYAGAAGGIAVCDITNKKSLEAMRGVIMDFYGTAGRVPVVILGNKSDQTSKAQISMAVLDGVAKSFNAPYFMTSAKTGKNVNVAFKTIGERLVNDTFLKDK